MKKVIIALGLTLTLGFAGTAYAASTTQDPSGGYNYNLHRTDAIGSSGYIPNANMSGYQVNIKDSSDPTLNSAGDTPNQTVVKSAYTDATNSMLQRTHGSYARNTNSCASCHKTHTAEARNLLIKSDNTETCTACHDGTLGFYNVFDPADTKDAAGTFGGDVSADNASMHMVDESVAVAAAPGNYNIDSSKVNQDGFSCASCHAPHGSYSDRLLNFDPGGQGVIDQVYGGMDIVGQDMGLYTLATMNTGLSKASPRYVVVRDSIANFTAAGSSYNFITTDSKISGIADTSTPVATVCRLVYSGTWKYTPANTAWMYGAEYGSPAYVDFYTGSVASKSDPLISNVNVDYAKGFAWGTGLSTANLKANIAQSVIVKLDLKTRTDIPNATLFNVVYSQDSTLWSGGSWAGSGVKMSQFCAACHVDYLTHSGGWDGGTTGSGMYSSSFRHSTDSDSYTCVRCHFSHGNSIDIIRDANASTLADLTATGAQFDGDVASAKAYLKDTNPSSALKKFTNMSVCWGCHTSSHAVGLQNNSNYVQNFSNSKYYSDGTTKQYTAGLPTGY